MMEVKPQLQALVTPGLLSLAILKPLGVQTRETQVHFRMHMWGHRLLLKTIAVQNHILAQQK